MTPTDSIDPNFKIESFHLFFCCFFFALPGLSTRSLTSSHFFSFFFFVKDEAFSFFHRQQFVFFPPGRLQPDHKRVDP